MGIFSKFRENVADQKEIGNVKSGLDDNAGDTSSIRADVVTTPPVERGLIESVGDMLQHSANNMKEVVFGNASDGDIGSLPCALAMEDPFSQSDNVLAAVVERDVRSSINGDEGDTQGKTIVQTVRENIAYSAHVVRDSVLGHSHVAEPNGNRLAQATSPAGDDGNNGADEHRKTIIETMGDMMLHPVQTVKDIVGSNTNVVESSPIDSSMSSQERVNTDNGDDRKKTIVENVSEMLIHSGETVKEAVLRHACVDHSDTNGVCYAASKQEPSSADDPGKRQEHEDVGEVKGLMQSVKDAAHEVKEEVMEAVQEVKDAVLSSDTLPNVPESITEDAGERPSMELVHTIVHD